MSIKTIIDDANKNSSSRKTKNSDLYYSLIIGVCTDDDYVAKNVKEIKNGELITEDLKLAPAFRKIIVAALKKGTNMSEAEANEIAKDLKLTREQAATLANIVHEADYLATKECNKKVQLFNKPGLDVTIESISVPERIRPNPQDKSKGTKAKAHDSIKIKHKLHAFQKEVVNIK